jgi:hypothetical protein
VPALRQHHPLPTLIQSHFFRLLSEELQILTNSPGWQIRERGKNTSFLLSLQQRICLDLLEIIEKNFDWNGSDEQIKWLSVSNICLTLSSPGCEGNRI